MILFVFLNFVVLSKNFPNSIALPRTSEIMLSAAIDCEHPYFVLTKEGYELVWIGYEIWIGRLGLTFAHYENLLYSTGTLLDDSDPNGRKSKKEGVYIYIQLIHSAV